MRRQAAWPPEPNGNSGSGASRQTSTAKLQRGGRLDISPRPVLVGNSDPQGLNPIPGGPRRPALVRRNPNINFEPQRLQPGKPCLHALRRRDPGGLAT